MRTLWDREVAPDADLIEGLAPRARLELALRVVEETLQGLSSECQALLAGSPGETVQAALEAIRASLLAQPIPPVDDLVDELFTLSDDPELATVWQLFNALTYCVGVPAEEMSVRAARETLAACYDVVRECAGIEEFPIGTPEATVLAADLSNQDCVQAISRQRDLIHQYAQA